MSRKAKVVFVKYPAFLVVLMLVVGLVAGLGLGSALFPKTQTETKYLTKTEYSTVLSTAISTLKERVIETKVTPTTVYSTLMVERVSVSRVTTTMTSTHTMTKTMTVTSTLLRTVYPSVSETVLLTDSGSGDKDTRPFTLDEVADLRIVVKIYPTADLKWVAFIWYLYIPGTERWIKNGEVNEEAGTFEFYAAKIPPGNYYIKVLAANCKWEITVEKVLKA